MSTTNLEYLSLCVHRVLTKKHWVLLFHGHSWALGKLLKRKTEISALPAAKFNCWVVFPSTLSHDYHGTSAHHLNPGLWKSILKGSEIDRMIFFISSWTITGTGWGLAPVLGLRADCFLHLQERFPQSVSRKLTECVSQAVQTHDVSSHSDFSWQRLSGASMVQLPANNLNPGKFSLKGRRLGLGESRLLLAPVY